MTKRIIYLFAPLADKWADRTEEIQAAIDYATDGDSIVLSAGSYYFGKPLSLPTGVKVLDSVFEKKNEAPK